MPDSDSDSNVTNILEKKRKEMQRKDTEKVAKVVLNLYKNTMHRYKNTKDPATKYTLLVDKLCLALDLGMAALTAYVDEENMDSRLQEEINYVSSDLQAELGHLMDWIQSPNYSPDRPYGNQVMKDAEISYQDRTA